MAAEQKRDVFNIIFRQKFGYINKTPLKHIFSIERKKVMRTIIILKIYYEQKVFE